MMDFDAARTSAANGNMPMQADMDDVKRIGEMADEFGVTLRTLRFYEDKGLLNPIRDGNARLYTRKDQARLKLILLGRKVGFSLRDVKQMMDLYDPAGANCVLRSKSRTSRWAGLWPSGLLSRRPLRPCRLQWMLSARSSPEGGQPGHGELKGNPRDAL